MKHLTKEKMTEVKKHFEKLGYTCIYKGLPENCYYYGVISIYKDGYFLGNIFQNSEPDLVSAEDIKDDEKYITIFDDFTVDLLDFLWYY